MDANGQGSCDYEDPYAGVLLEGETIRSIEFVQHPKATSVSLNSPIGFTVTSSGRVLCRDGVSGDAEDITLTLPFPEGSDAEVVDVTTREISREYGRSVHGSNGGLRVISRGQTAVLVGNDGTTFEMELDGDWNKQWNQLTQPCPNLGFDAI